MLLLGIFFGALAANVFAHMALDFPPAFNASKNPYRTTAADPYLQYPYDCCGENDRWQYPCRGYHKLLNTPEGAPTATWETGSIQNWTISGIGNHYGGSCQVGFSLDGGDTFRVATSYEGNCPHRENGNGPSGQDFPFKVPHDITPGVHIFAWIWYNREQEFNMNCAAVNITSPSGTSTTPSPYSTATPTLKTKNGCTCTCELPTNISTCDCNCFFQRRDDNSVSFSSRPLMFVADNGNDCLTPHTTAELKFPDPGPEVVEGDGVYQLALPSGSCSPTQMLAKQGYNGLESLMSG